MKKIVIYFFILLLGINSVYSSGTYEHEKTEITEEGLKRRWNRFNLQDGKRVYSDEIEGIYLRHDKNSDVNNYVIGVIRKENEYIGIYLSGSSNDSWHEGDLKVIFHISDDYSNIKTTWFMDDGSRNENYVSEFHDLQIEVKDTTSFFGTSDTYMKIYPKSLGGIKKEGATGTGFLLNRNGYIVTNHHVIDGSEYIFTRGLNGDFNVCYPLSIELLDKENDIAVLKFDTRLIPVNDPPYGFESEETKVGEDVFTLGYPLIDSMGSEIKLATGIISSSSGYKGETNNYQISVPVNPGNSGGPLFDNNGDIIGITSSTLLDAAAVHYAVKFKYVIDLINRSDKDIRIWKQLINRFEPQILIDRVKVYKDYIYLIEAY